MEKLENGKNPAHFLNRFLTYSCSDFVIYMPDSGLYQKIGQRIFPVTRNIQLSESLSNFDLNYLFALMTSLHSNGPSEKSTREIKVKVKSGLLFMSVIQHKAFGSFFLGAHCNLQLLHNTTKQWKTL